MIYTLTIQSAPEDSPDFYFYSTKTKLEAVARHHLIRWNEHWGFDIPIDEWLSNSSVKQTLFMPGGFPWAQLEKTEG